LAFPPFQFGTTPFLQLSFSPLWFSPPLPPFSLPLSAFLPFSTWPLLPPFLDIWTTSLSLPCVLEKSPPVFSFSLTPVSSPLAFVSSTGSPYSLTTSPSAMASLSVISYTNILSGMWVIHSFVPPSV
jgi:hypothetical protein